MLGYGTYLIAFLSLLGFSILAALYMYKPTHSQSQELGQYETAIFRAKEVACAFPASGQYGTTLQWTYYALLVVTVTLRHQEWLAAGTAAYALTYSGVATIHLVVLFAVYNRFPGDPARSSCHTWNLGGGVEEAVPQVPICTGVYDPDSTEACTVVGAGLLAVLPMATWSRTFQHVSAKPILVMWTLMLAVGHMVYNLIISDDHRHYQICSASVEEPLPGRGYNAVPFDADWKQSFNEIIRGFPVSSSSNQSCIYTCFESDAYIGRMADDIGVYHANILKLNKSQGSRSLGIAYWFLYLLLATAVVLAENSKRCKKSQLAAYGRRFVQFVSVAAYIGYVAWLGVQPSHGGLPQSESFNSVGQWSVVAIIVMALMAAVTSKITAAYWCERTEKRGTNVGKEEDELPLWSCDVGYAS
ncbi:uncharacterized protein EKO05_0003330 [Ascochyta rabiei]|uniref:uncharacterized protein n=1 Tax=Didymella rabiei TaxID=5454 RepID=UPI0021FF3EBF|nr:uncharacterized protein EKO05_0003330 [Ascochyta rabiei]UPX12793.1 hypothetical protein EKO05_0003330 [Ascochyta rabiei]